MKSVFLFLGLLVTGVLAGSTFTECKDGDDYHIELMGNSGQFAYKPCNESDDNWLKIKIDSITEYKPSGQKTNNKVNSFSGGDWKSDSEDSSYANYTLTRSTKNGDIVFSLYTRILDNGTDVDLGGGDHYTADGGELKWGFTVENWKFYDDDNYLSAAFHFDAKGENKHDDNDTDDFKVGGFPILSPDFATVNSDTRVNVTVTHETTGGGKKATYTVDVDFYGNDALLDYDPIVESDDDDSDDDDNFNNTKCEEGDDYHIEVMGNSGQFAYKPCDESEDSWLKIRIDSVTEYTDSDHKTNNKLNSFTGGDWQSDASDSTYAKYLLETSTKNGDVVFSLYTRILDNGTDVDLGGDELYVSEGGELKWGFTIDGWQFSDETDYLVAVFHFDTKGGNDGKDQNDTGDFKVGGFPVLSPDFATFTPAIAGNTRMNVTVTHETTGGGKKATYTVTVDFYGNDALLDYDPIVGPMSGGSHSDGSSSNGLSDGAIVGIVFGVLGAVAFAGAVLYIVLKKKADLKRGHSLGSEDYHDFE